jgi:DNA-binding GntR family transcriptional regulator
MSTRKIRSQSSSKIPSYLPIYNMLYSDIINGLYEEGTILPSESALGERYKVSRHTIRQALTILTEDGLIHKQQGKGSIITNKSQANYNQEKNIYNIMLECAKKEIDEIDIEYNFSPPTDIAMERLGINANEIVMASNSIYYIEGKPVGHGFFQIPVKYINLLPIDLNKEKDISELINKNIFDMAHSAKLHIRLVLAEENIIQFLDVKENEPIIYIEEILKNEEYEGIARCKYYFIPNYFDINLNL